jgi:hypothetical protein
MFYGTLCLLSQFFATLSLICSIFGMGCPLINFSRTCQATTVFLCEFQDVGQYNADITLKGLLSDNCQFHGTYVLVDSIEVHE